MTNSTTADENAARRVKTESTTVPARSDVRVYGDVAIRDRRSNARGWPVGQAHHNARHSDAAVAQARSLRAAGMSHRQVGHALGVPWKTAEGWTSMRKRRPHARVVVTRAHAAAPSVSNPGGTRAGVTPLAETTPAPTATPQKGTP